VVVVSGYWCSCVDWMESEVLSSSMSKSILIKNGFFLNFRIIPPFYIKIMGVWLFKGVVLVLFW